MSKASKKRSKVFNGLLALFACYLFVSLGLWQLHRAEQKRLLIAEFLSRSSMHFLQIEDLNISEPLLSNLRYFPIRVSGRYDNEHTILLDNKFYAHQVGYEVLTPFMVDKEHKLLLIDRGWVPRMNDRKKLPSIPTVTGQQTLHGLLYVPLGKPFVLKSLPLNNSRWPLVAEALQFDQFEQALGQSAYPAVIWLDKDEPHGFIRDWHPVFMPPHKHIGYALQWFAFALIVLIVYIALNYHAE